MPAFSQGITEIKGFNEQLQMLVRKRNRSSVKFPQLPAAEPGNV
jgi:hypothetical protein